MNRNYRPHVLGIDDGPFDKSAVSEVTDLDGSLAGTRDGVEPLSLFLYEVIARPSFSIVQLHRRRHEETSAAGAMHRAPLYPVVEQGADPRDARRLLQGWGDHEGHEAVSSGPERLHLEVFLGSEVGKQPALGQPRLGRQRADRDAVEPGHRGQVDCLCEDGVACSRAFSHDRKKHERSFMSTNRFQ